MAKQKAANIFLELHNKQIDLKEIQKMVASVRGTQDAYINVHEGRVYCVLENGDTKELDII